MNGGNQDNWQSAAAWQNAADNRKRIEKLEAENKTLANRLERIEQGLGAAIGKSEATALTPRHQKLGQFYGVGTNLELIDRMEHHIERLQDKLHQYQPGGIAAPAPVPTR